ncbi:MAG: hypothetical protein SGI72_01615 [Planctomycetota bacterium]|nr:hypothetical protein [Planctomycetota bacterium]
MQISQRVFAAVSLALVSFAQAPAFANVLKVAPSGAPFTQIQAAVTAAGPDDVILISSGSYGAVTIDGKSLTLCSTTAGIVSILGTTTVKNLTPTQRVVLSGLKGYGPITSGFPPLGAGAGLVVVNNAGHVRVEKCTFEGAIGWGDNTTGGSFGGCCDMSAVNGGRAGAMLRDNAQGVSFVACALKGGRGANAIFQVAACDCGSGSFGGEGLSVTSTLTALYDCSCIGGGGGHDANGGAGGPGCGISSGTLLSGAFASGTSFQGGNGGNSWGAFPFLVGSSGGHGLVVGSSTSARVLNVVFSGGAGGFKVSEPGVPPAPPGAQGASGASFSSSGPIFFDTESKLVMTTDRVAHGGTVVTLRVQGLAGQNIRLLVSRSSTFQILPSWRGTLLSALGKGAVDVPMGTIPASGLLERRYLVPQLPAGATSGAVFVQAYRFDPVLGLKLSAGTTVTLLR